MGAQDAALQLGQVVELLVDGIPHRVDDLALLTMGAAQGNHCAARLSSDA